MMSNESLNVSRLRECLVKYSNSDSLEDLQDALRLVRECVKDFPFSSRLKSQESDLLFLEAVHRDMGFQRSLDASRKAVELDPFDSKSLEVFANGLFRESDPAAKQWFEYSIAAQATVSNNLGLARVFIEMGDFDSASECLDDARRLCDTQLDEVEKLQQEVSER